MLQTSTEPVNDSGLEDARLAVTLKVVPPPLFSIAFAAERFRLLLARGKEIGGIDSTSGP